MDLELAGLALDAFLILRNIFSASQARVFRGFLFWLFFLCLIIAFAHHPGGLAVCLFLFFLFSGLGWAFNKFLPSFPFLGTLYQCLFFSIFVFFLLFFRHPVPRYFSSLLGWAVSLPLFPRTYPGSPIGLFGLFLFQHNCSFSNQSISRLHY